MGRAAAERLDEGYSAPIPALDHPDPEDRHAVAAEIVGDSDEIVACNLQDLPKNARASGAIKALRLDDFPAYRLEPMPDRFRDASRRMRTRMATPLDHCPTESPRRYFLGLTPVHALNARENAESSEYPRQSAISVSGISWFRI